jgi:tRNA A-37 threonylcarbamoyl transferase component Bud32
MEEFQSQTLHEMLMDWKTILGFKLNIYNLVNAAQLTGKMLSVFHNQLHKCYEIEEPCQPIIEEVQALFERMTGANHKQNLANSVLPKFVQKIKALQTRKVLYSSNHGDMTTDNLLYSTENKVCLIDIKTKQAPIYSDIGLIMIHPDVFLYQIFTFGLLLRKQTIEAYRSAILKGYFGDRMIDKDLINLYCAIKMLDKWVMYEEIMSKSKGIKRLRSFLAAPFVRAYFKPRIDKYLNLINVSFQPK